MGVNMIMLEKHLGRIFKCLLKERSLVTSTTNAFIKELFKVSALISEMKDQSVSLGGPENDYYALKLTTSLNKLSDEACNIEAEIPFRVLKLISLMQEELHDTYPNVLFGNR